MSDVTERTYWLPFGQYDDGSVGMAVPGVALDAYNAMFYGMRDDPSGFNSASPEQRADYDSRNTQNAMMVGSTAAIGSLPFPRPANSLGAMGMLPKHMRAANDSSIRSIVDGNPNIATGSVDSSAAVTPMPWGREVAGNMNVMPKIRAYTPHFVDQALRRSGSASITAEAAYQKYINWARQNGLEPSDEGHFSRAMGELGFNKSKIGGRIRYIGIE